MAARDLGIGIIALVPDYWSGVWMPRHHVIGRLARRFETVWIEPSAGWRDYWPLNRVRKETIQSVGASDFGLNIYDPGRWLPEFYYPRQLGDWVRRKRVVRARRVLERKGCRRFVLYLWRPDFDWALNAVDADLTVYHIDDEYSFSTTDEPNQSREVSLIRAADLVIIHSAKLLAKKGGINPQTIHVPNGVDYSAFATPAPMPADMASIPTPRLGYVGVVKSQLDLDLLLRLAERHPEWHFVIVGPTGHLGGKEELYARLVALRNVHALGNRPLRALPAYVQAMDVCMMCYEVNDYTNCIYPLKLNEYLASGRPIVSSAIDSVLPLAGLISIAGGPDAWEAALAKVLATSALDPSAVSRRREEAAKHDWDVLVERIAGRIVEQLKSRGPGNASLPNVRP